MSADFELHRILFNENLAESFKQNAERFLAYMEKLYANYCAFTVKRPYLGLFFAIFIVFSAFPILCYIVFLTVSTTVIIGGALCLGLLILSFILGLAGLVLSIALICAFFSTCVVCFWVVLTLTITRFIDGYLKTNSFGMFNFSKLSNGVNEDVGPSESQGIYTLSK
ncbi:17313_t:CDS:2 [Dentiscutata heterogama]|uniref:17313_t:CDS:1 n=1 Tax=Dentiscutata heterogama TaxID=1316150 RepID=A0ACA9JX63_9GLOM|nr:17313_t:CDS:2 [Dentiscutata heterogama]